MRHLGFLMHSGGVRVVLHSGHLGVALHSGHLLVVLLHVGNLKRVLHGGHLGVVLLSFIHHGVWARAGVLAWFGGRSIHWCG